MFLCLCFCLLSYLEAQYWFCFAIYCFVFVVVFCCCFVLVVSFFGFQLKTSFKFLEILRTPKMKNTGILTRARSKNVFTNHVFLCVIEFSFCWKHYEHSGFHQNTGKKKTHKNKDKTIMCKNWSKYKLKLVQVCWRNKIGPVLTHKKNCFFCGGGGVKVLFFLQRTRYWKKCANA